MTDVPKFKINRKPWKRSQSPKESFLKLPNGKGDSSQELLRSWNLNSRGKFNEKFLVFSVLDIPLKSGRSIRCAAKSKEIVTADRRNVSVSREWFNKSRALFWDFEKEYALKQDVGCSFLNWFASFTSRIWSDHARRNQPSLPPPFPSPSSSPAIHCPRFIIQWLSELHFPDYFLDGSSECFIWF